jgi:hypothetical protein
MTLKLICPVCDRPDIESNCCPNCETDLSIVRMVLELPKNRDSIQGQILAAVLVGGMIVGLTMLAVQASF